MAQPQPRPYHIAMAISKDSPDPGTSGDHGDSSGFVPVRSFASEIEANLAVAALRNEDIDARLVGSGLDPYFGSASGLWSEMQVMVPSPDADRARQMLEEIAAKAVRRAEEEGGNEP